MNEDFACLPVFLKQFPHFLLSDVRRKIAHKEPATLGEGLLSWFPKILQVNSQAFIWEKKHSHLKDWGEIYSHILKQLQLLLDKKCNCCREVNTISQWNLSTNHLSLRMWKQYAEIWGVEGRRADFSTALLWSRSQPRITQRKKDNTRATVKEKTKQVKELYVRSDWIFTFKT